MSIDWKSLIGGASKGAVVGGPVGAGVGAIIGGVSGYINNKQDKKREKTYLDSLKGKSPEEENYLKVLKNRAEKGTLPVGELSQTYGNRLYEGKSQTAGNIMGRFAGSGMENSIVAQDTLRKLDTDTQRQLATEIKDLALKNEQTKLTAQDSLGSYGEKRSNLLRDIAGKKYDFDSARADASQFDMDSMDDLISIGQQAFPKYFGTDMSELSINNFKSMSEKDFDSKIAEMVKKGASQEEIKALLTLWGKD